MAPISLLLTALLSGLLIAPLWTPPELWFFVPLGLAGAGLFLRSSRWQPALLLTALVCAGPTLYWDVLSPQQHPNDLRNLDDGTYHILSGELVRQHRALDNRSRLDLAGLTLHKGGQSTALSGRLRLTVDHLERSFLPGDVLQFRSKIRQPRTFGTPGEFNYPRYLAARGIYASAYLAKGRDLAHRADLTSRNVLRPFFHLRTRTAVWLDAQLDQEQALLMKALLIGERGAFPTSLRERVSGAGLAHLLAISGLHLGLLGWFLYQLGLFLYRRSTRLLIWNPPARVLPLLLIPFLGGYTLLTGSALATCRAFFMFALAALCLLRGERQRPLNLLQLVLFLFLLINPLLLWDPGLQLSVAGVAGILLLVPHWQKHLPANHPSLKRVLEVPLATVAATLATAPLVGLHFHQMIPAGLISNLVAIPLIGFGALPVGIFACLLEFCGLPGSELLIRLAGQLASLALNFGERVSAVQLLAPRPWFPDLPQLGIACLLILGILLLGSRRWKQAALCAALTACLLLPVPRDGLRITALSVGQGESLLVELPDDRTLLVDGGGLRSPTFDVGERLVAPALGRMGIRQLDSVILTHTHPDHYRGLAFILNKVPVKTFVSAHAAPNLPTDLTRSLRPGTEIRQLNPGWHHYISDADYRVGIHIPDQDTSEINDRSLAVYIGYGQEGVLLTGDLEAEGVRNLIDDFPSWPVSLLKLPHHGSRHSDVELLLDQLQPELALVSAGFNNSYRLPSKQTVEACDIRQIRLLRTDLQGSVQLKTSGQGWHVNVAKAGLFH